MRLAIISDAHLLATSLIGDNVSFRVDEARDTKMLLESRPIFERACDVVCEWGADLIIVPGDMTKDGEFASNIEAHDLLMNLRERLSGKGVDSKVLAICGNHDINNSRALDFSEGFSVPATKTTPDDFRKIWHDCGYDGALSEFSKWISERNGKGDIVQGWMSYSTRPVEGLTIIALDTCKYISSLHPLGKEERQTSGMVSPELLEWLSIQVREAHDRGDAVLVFQHHGIVPHFDMEPVLMPGFLVDGYESVCRAYSDMGIKVVLTGHMHSNDISREDFENGRSIYDVETGSLVTYPSCIRLGDIELEPHPRIRLEQRELGSVRSDGYGKIAPIEIDDITSYGSKRLLTVEKVNAMLYVAYFGPLIRRICESGSKYALSKTMHCSIGELSEVLWNRLVKNMPKSRESGLAIDYKDSIFLSVWHDVSKDRLMIDRVDRSLGPDAYARIVMNPDSGRITNTAVELIRNRGIVDGTSDNVAFATLGSFARFLDETTASLDERVVEDKGGAREYCEKLVSSIATQEVDSNHTILELVEYSYMQHLMGNEDCAPWAEEDIEKLGAAHGDYSLYGISKKVAVELSNSEESSDFFGGAGISLETLLCHGGSSDVVSRLIYRHICNIATSMQDLMLLTARVIRSKKTGFAKLTRFVSGSMYSLSHDQSGIDDHFIDVEF
ncbi:MAG: metallophosphoesterase family protein [Coriobacteriales bacterium]|jgi:hypothetical protein